MPATKPANSQSLVPRIGFWPATSVIIGSIIGAGIFMKPSTMAAQLGSPVWLVLVWILAGIFSLLGALIYAELGAMMPETGGIYIYFRKMFGDFVAFLFGWAAFSVINTAAVAAISFVCAQYADYFLHLPRFSQEMEKGVVWAIPFIGDLHPLENFGVKSLAVLLVLLLTGLNYLSVKAGSAFQVISTFLKMAVIGALVVGIFTSGKGDLQHFINAEHPKTGWGLLGAIAVAMTGAFYAYDGWINVTYIAGEIKQPQKNIPKSLATGVFICIVIYVLVNQSYLYVLPLEKVAGSSLVASDAFTIAMGGTGAAIVNAMIVICTLGAINGNTMATARVTYAMGKDKVFLPWAGKTHPKFQTPGNALILHGAWTCMFIITGSFDMLADMFVFITWIVYGLGAVGIFLLRKKMPDQPRPYKIWGYPVVPLLFIAFAGFYLGTTVYNDVSNYLAHKQPVINSVLGMIITSIGVPLYFYFKQTGKGQKVNS
jgi:APA family basic amino acid/polyamine antiporter